MYLSKNSLVKIILTASAFLIIGAVFFCAAYFIGKSEISPKPTIIIGAVFTSLAFISFPTVIYADGISKPFSEGDRLVRRDLQPEKFILFYKELTNKENSAVIKERYDMLELLYLSYRLLDDRRGALEVVQRMKTELKEKYRPKAAVYYAELLYEKGDVQTADGLLSEAEKKDGGSELCAMVDAARRSARARAVSDRETEEKYYTGLLSAAGIFKADNAAALFAHFRLYEICKEEGRDKEAAEHLKYCAENGGRTAISKLAKKLS